MIVGDSWGSEQLQGSDDRIQQLYWPQRDSDVLFLE